MTGEIDRVRDVYDRYARDPSLVRRWAPDRPGNRAMVAERDRTAEQVLRRNDAFPTDGRILDVGCGNGSVLTRLGELAPSARLSGIDVVWDRIRAAKLTAPRVGVAMADGRNLPFPDALFDLSLAYTVFSSILDDDVAREIAAEMERVTKPGGWILLYDFRRHGPGNPNTRAIGVDKVRSLFAHDVVDVERLTLVPPLARALRRTARWAYRPLAAVPLLRTHHLVLVRRR